MKRKKRLASFAALSCAMLGLLPVGYLIAGCIQHPGGFRSVYYDTPYTLYRFWSSLLICTAITVGHMVISCWGGYGLAKFPLPGRRGVTIALIILMLLPLQVTLVPSYLILSRLHLLDTVWALILPSVFSPFGTVVMWMTFRAVPDELVDAARLDGAGEHRILWRILLPTGRTGAASVLLLTFIDAWNMVEQPMVFLTNTAYYPISVFLSSADGGDPALSFHGGMLAMLPVVLLLVYLRQELVDTAGK